MRCSTPWHAGQASRREVTYLSPPAALRQQGDEGVGRWLALAPGGLGRGADPMELPYGEVWPLLRQAGPALLRLSSDGEPCILAPLGGGRRRGVYGAVLRPRGATGRPGRPAA